MFCHSVGGLHNLHLQYRESEQFNADRGGPQGHMSWEDLHHELISSFGIKPNPAVCPGTLSRSAFFTVPASGVHSRGNRDSRLEKYEPQVLTEEQRLRTSLQIVDGGVCTGQGDWVPSSLCSVIFMDFFLFFS